MELAITIVIVSVVSIAMGILWVNGIDSMHKNYPDYRGEDLFDEDLETNDKEKQRELIKEIIQADEKDGLYDEWDATLMDGLENEPYILSSIDGDVFFEGISNETEPNELLKEAAEKYKKSKK